MKNAFWAQQLVGRHFVEQVAGKDFGGWREKIF